MPPKPTKTRSIWSHLAVASLILGVSFLLFTFFPSIFPHPEDFSNYSEVIAFFAIIAVLIMIKDGKRRWFLLPILVICLLALLDEIGYGSEVNLIKPFYSQTYHTEIRDLHNLIELELDLGSKALADRHWNGDLFVQFLALDGVLLAAGLLFGWLLRLRKPLSEPPIRTRIFWLVSSFWLASGLVVAAYLLGLPQDPKNSFLLGYSAIRLLSAVGTFLISTAPILFLFSQRGTPERALKSFSSWLSERSRSILIISIVLTVASLTYQFYAPLVFLPDQITRLERVTPLMLWLLAIAWFTMLGVSAWRGRLRRPVSELFTRLASFFRREPAYLYTVFGVVLILVAQLIDKNVIPLNAVVTPNFHVKLWGLWTEETFEMNASFLFLVAAFYFPESK